MTTLNTFNHQAVAKKWLTHWQQEQIFHAKVDYSKTPYTVLLPPPNVTAKLHMGHGLSYTVQDILIRWKRMQGYCACWLPGTDHAGIATQMMVERALLNEGSSRESLGREAFFQRCIQWKNENGQVIVEQMKQMGFSCDWPREAYTMEEKLSYAVRTLFVKLFDDGYIYQGQRLVNWDPELQTALSDDEVQNIEHQGKLWHIRYQVSDDKNQSLVVATTRPETLFGDAAVAVNPEDERYQHLIGKTVSIPVSGRIIPIIADSYVKTDFGTGCLKITPAHDHNDFVVGKRHQLDFINIFDKKACLNEKVPESYQGMQRFDARKKLIKELKTSKLLVDEKNYKTTLPISDRSKAVIEPRLSKQWFVKMKELAQPALKEAKANELNFYPDSYRKVFLHWLENIEDWCISRQLWWGHRMPIFTCNACKHVFAAIDTEPACTKCNNSALTQDPDVLDTWFSSWLWPVSPFGWPQQTKDLSYFFPSNVLVTGAEIIFLWVARMIMMSHYVMGKSPFKDIYFNSIICDKQGRKFSKTLGNGIDPLEVIAAHGADAVRFTCISLAPIGSRVKMEKSDFDIGTRFINKIWNAGRFILHYWNEQKQTPLAVMNFSQLNIPQRWLINELKQTIKNINTQLSNYQINDATNSLYHFTWHSFCDWGIEAAKLTLNTQDNNQKQQALSLLIYVFDHLLRLLSPFIPFVTEELWSLLPKHPQVTTASSCLSSASFPQINALKSFDSEAQSWQQTMTIIGSIRSLRTQAQISPKASLNVQIIADFGLKSIVQANLTELNALSGATCCLIKDSEQVPKNSLIAAGNGYTIYVAASDHLDIKKEVSRLTKEISRLQGIKKGLAAKLQNQAFIVNAPITIVNKAKKQLANIEQQLVTNQKSLSTLDTFG